MISLQLTTKSPQLQSCDHVFYCSLSPLRHGSKQLGEAQLQPELVQVVDHVREVTVHSLHSLHVRHPFVFLHPVSPLSEGPRDLSLSLGRKDMQELARLQDDRVPVGPVLLDVPGPAEISGTLKGGFAMRL